MSTIKEIADRAGVSLGTVDRVLHNRGRVSPDTARRIREVIEELGFTPNLFARNLSTSKVWTFGVLMPHPDQDAGFWKIPFEGMRQAVTANRAYRISLKEAFFDRYKPESFAKAHRELCAAGVDAIIMAPVIPQATMDILNGLGPGSPVHLCFDTAVDHPAVMGQIAQDSRRSGRLAARLMKLLCPRGGTVAVLKPDTDNPHIVERILGMQEGLGGSSLTLLTRILPHLPDPGSHESLVRSIAAEHQDLCGILVTDATTHVVASALASAGIRCPLIGYDLMAEDVRWLEDGTIDFLITQDPKGQGVLAVQNLVDHLILDRPVAARMSMPITVVCRENYADFLGR